MSWIPDRYRELRSLLRPERIEDDVAEELALHLELRVADLVARGMSADAAREEAKRRFGDVSKYSAETCAIDESILRERRRMEVIDSIRRETRHSLRALTRAPVFTIVAVLTLGLGTGATTAIFTMLDAIVLRPLPYREPERLVQITHAVPRVQEGQEWQNSVASYVYYGEHSTSFDGMGAYSRGAYPVSDDGDAERLTGAQTTASLLPLLGARAVIGRLYNEEDDVPGADPVVLLSHEIWQSRYNGDESVVGRTINVNATPVTVIGVLEPGFSLPNHETHVWLPWQLDLTEVVNSHYVNTYARLKSGVTPQAAQTELAQLQQRLPTVFPKAYSTSFFERSGFSARVHPLRSVVLGKAASGTRVGIDNVLWMLLGAVALVLLIACANVANLMLVRSEVRRRELTVRAALGAERAHMAVHHLVESLLLSTAAAIVGIFLAWAGIQLLLALAPPTLPRLGEIAVSRNSLLFAIGISALTGVLFGLVPVIRQRTSFGELRESGRGMTVSRHRQLVRNTLVIGQVAMALVLLAAGGLMLKSFFNLREVRSGIDGENVLTFNVSLPPSRYDDEPKIYAFQREFVERVNALAGVGSVGASSSLPLSGSAGCAHTSGEGTEQGVCIPVAAVLPGYFETLGIPVSGASFTWNDHDTRANKAIISRALADRLWPGQDPIGRQIISFQDGPPWFRIVGVAENVLADGLDQPPAQNLYYLTRQPALQGYYGPHGVPRLWFVVRTSLDQPEALTNSIRGVLREMDREVPLAEVKSMQTVIMSSEKMARTTFTMMLLGIAAIIALFLSAVGLYGVIAYLVGRRRAEIGVRMALGARVSEVARLVIMQSVRLTVAGIAIGVVAAFFVTRALASLVYEVEPTDPATLLMVSLLLVLVAVIASAVPARRAAATAPSEALRAD